MRILKELGYDFIWLFIVLSLLSGWHTKRIVSILIAVRRGSVHDFAACLETESDAVAAVKENA